MDASVAVGVVRAEPIAPEALALLGRARTSGSRVLVPSIFWLEVLNSLGRRHRLPPAAILEALAELDAFGLETVDLDRPMLLLTLDAVARYGLTAYDAAYLALAESADAQLLTTDARLAATAGSRAVLVSDGSPQPPPRAVAEPSTPHAATWTDWPGAAAYLRDLRARLA